MNSAIREFHRYRHGLCVVDGVPCQLQQYVITLGSVLDIKAVVADNMDPRPSESSSLSPPIICNLVTLAAAENFFLDNASAAC